MKNGVGEAPCIIYITKQVQYHIMIHTVIQSSTLSKEIMEAEIQQHLNFTED